MLLTGIATGLGLVAALAWSLQRPQQRLWPPVEPHRHLRIAAIWCLTVAPFVAGLWVGVAEAGPWPVLSFPIRALGAALMLVGLGLVGWGIGYLSWHQTIDHAGHLVTTGPYRWTRNPQYLGDLLLIAGFVLLTGALPLLWIAAPLAAGLILFPFTEEPWLAAQFGEAYAAYKARTPRFF